MLGKPRPKGKGRCLRGKITGKTSGDSGGYPCFCFLSSDLRLGIILSGPLSVLWVPKELGLGQAQLPVSYQERAGFGYALRVDFAELTLERVTGWFRLEWTSGLQLVQLPC